MRQLKKLAYAAFGLLALTGCEGGELYDVNAPDWISDKIQEIEDSKKDPQEGEKWKECWKMYIPLVIQITPVDFGKHSLNIM